MVFEGAVGDEVEVDGCGRGVVAVEGGDAGGAREGGGEVVEDFGFGGEDGVRG